MYMHALLGLASLVILSTACLEPEVLDPGAAGVLEEHEHHPFHVAVFKHAPTEDEIQDDFAQFLMTAYGPAGSSSLDPIDPVPPLQSGQKLVRIDATTSGISNAGTDSANGVSFEGHWQRSNDQSAQHTFFLNNPNKDDLDQGTVSVFYYVLSVGNVTDRFSQGRIANTSTDGWYCKNITLTENNSFGAERTQLMPFNQWVDSPSVVTSPWRAATNDGWLTY